jgi:hypothetical protein
MQLLESFVESHPRVRGRKAVGHALQNEENVTPQRAGTKGWRGDSSCSRPRHARACGLKRQQWFRDHGKTVPCIFQKKDHEFSDEGTLIVVVEGCGPVGRGPRGGQRAALSTASGLLRASARTVHLSTASRRDVFRGRCAKPDTPMSMQLAG